MRCAVTMARHVRQITSGGIDIWRDNCPQFTQSRLDRHYRWIILGSESSCKQKEGSKALAVALYSRGGCSDRDLSNARPTSIQADSSLATQASYQTRPLIHHSNVNLTFCPRPGSEEHLPSHTSTRPRAAANGSPCSLKVRDDPHTARQADSRHAAAASQRDLWHEAAVHRCITSLHFPSLTATSLLPSIHCCNSLLPLWWVHKHGAH